MSTTLSTSRPAPGRNGVKFKLRANYFLVQQFPTSPIQQYDIHIKPEVPISINRVIFSAFEKEFSSTKLDGAKLAYDGRKMVYSPKPLPFGHQASFEVAINGGREGITSSRKSPVRKFQISLRKVAELQGEEVFQLLQGGNRSLSAQGTAFIMALNVILSHVPSRDYVSRGGSFFFPLNSQNIPGGLEVWNGYFQSMKVVQGNLAVNMDTTHSTFYSGGPLVDIISRVLKLRSVDDLRRGIDDKHLRLLNRFLKGVRIRITHRANIKSKFRIHRVTANGCDKTLFKLGEGRILSVTEYFLERYQLHLNYSFLPCIEVNRGNFLPIEVCDVIEGQVFPRKISSDSAAAMMRATCCRPHERLNQIIDGIKLLKYGGAHNDYLEHFGFNVEMNLTQVEARVLETPTICFNRQSQETNIVPRDGTWNLRDKMLYSPQTLKSWAVVVFAPDRLYPLVCIQRFVEELENSCQKLGIIVDQLQPYIRYSDPQGNIKEILSSSLSNASRSAGDAQPQLLLIILPNTGAALYNQVKKTGETLLGICTQCIQAKNIVHPKAQFLASVCMKINAKLGGANFIVHPKEFVFVRNKPTVVVGADLTMVTPSTRTLSSIAVLVCSLDASCVQYATTMIYQQNGVVIKDVGNMMCELLRTFYQVTQMKPERIIYYRDGVSEGQLFRVQHEEVTSLKKGFSLLDPKYEPKLTFITIQKRHHCRLFPIDRAGTDVSGNCTPGTIVDSTIVHPRDFDFFLQSHAGLMGTSRPTHYRVLHDENSFSSDDLQTLTYQLCFVFARATKSVSLVTPAYYASLISRRTKCYFNEVTTDEESVDSGDEGIIPIPVVCKQLKCIPYYL